MSKFSLEQSNPLQPGQPGQSADTQRKQELTSEEQQRIQRVRAGIVGRAKQLGQAEKVGGVWKFSKEFIEKERSKMKEAMGAKNVEPLTEASSLDLQQAPAPQEPSEQSVNSEKGAVSNASPAEKLNVVPDLRRAWAKEHEAKAGMLSSILLMKNPEEQLGVARAAYERGVFSKDDLSALERMLSQKNEEATDGKYTTPLPAGTFPGVPLEQPVNPEEGVVPEASSVEERSIDSHVSERWQEDYSNSKLTFEGYVAKISILNRILGASSIENKFDIALGAHESGVLSDDDLLKLAKMVVQEHKSLRGERKDPPEVRLVGQYGEQAQTSEHARDLVLNPENKSFFGRMPEGGKKIANQIYERFYKIPGVDKVAGKLAIAYNQFWIDKHQEKNDRLKEKMERLDSRIGELGQSQKDIEAAIEKFKAAKIGGLESLEFQVKDIGEQVERLKIEKGAIQSSLTTETDKLEAYIKERDRIADKFISSYAGKIESMEKELKKLQSSMDDHSAETVVAEAKHKEDFDRLDNLNKTKIQIEAVLRRMGRSEEEIGQIEAIKNCEKMVADGFAKIRREKEDLSKRKAKISEEIARINVRVKQYTNKRDEFVRIQGGRSASPRNLVAPVESNQVIPEAGKGANAESSIEINEELAVETFIRSWNIFLANNYDGIVQLINQQDFLRGNGISREFRCNVNDFQEMLSDYYKAKGLPIDQFNVIKGNFFAEKVKGKK